MKKILLRRDRRAGYKNRHGDKAKSLHKEGTLGTGSEEGPSAGSGRRGRREFQRKAASKGEVGPGRRGLQGHSPPDGRSLGTSLKLESVSESPPYHKSLPSHPPLSFWFWAGGLGRGPRTAADTPGPGPPSLCRRWGGGGAVHGDEAPGGEKVEAQVSHAGSTMHLTAWGRCPPGPALLTELSSQIGVRSELTSCGCYKQ